MRDARRPIHAPAVWQQGQSCVALPVRIVTVSANDLFPVPLPFCALSDSLAKMVNNLGFFDLATESIGT